MSREKMSQLNSGGKIIAIESLRLQLKNVENRIEHVMGAYDNAKDKDTETAYRQQLDTLNAQHADIKQQIANVSISN